MTRWAPNHLCALIVAIFATVSSPLAWSDETDQVDFRREIRPLLADRCFHCHGPDETTRMADLRLDDWQSAIQVLSPEKPSDSELLRRVMSEDPSEVMPPPDENHPLSKSELDLLAKWIAGGAPWSQHWAYETPVRWPIPENPSTDWPLNWIDQFILSSLTEHRLGPSADADRITLLRRLSFDLTGLPPEPHLLTAPLEAEDDYQRIVERLLYSPHFGERLAMYWLDLVRYADTVGYHGDQDHNISAYRDWVIQAFNDGMPFDEMTRDQLAGDLVTQPTLAQRIATGYNRVLQTTHEGGLQPGEYRAIYAADRVRNLSSVWLGATVGCAQCHDHKFDPFTMRDFYSLAAFFADIDDESHFKTGSNDLPTRRDPELELPSEEQARDMHRLEHEIQSINEQIASGQAEADQVEELEKRKTESEASLRTIRKQVRRTMITVALPTPRITRILPRGNWMDESGSLVQPGVPEFLSRSSEQKQPSADDNQTLDQRRLNRLDLARWLTDPDEGIGLLTARVMVNRLWYLFFGFGLARDLSDFGNQGQVPLHPELLDNLAHYLVDHHWDFRSLIRLMVSSRAYRQSSVATQDTMLRDPDNRWVSRQSAHRLPAEMIRDSSLDISGLLVRNVGGATARPYQPAGYYRHLNFPTREYQSDNDQNQWRRGVYVHWQRQFLHPMLKAFDATNREECTADRPRSNTPLAALTLMNDPTFIEAARALAQSVFHADNLPVDADDRQRIDWLIVRATSRRASDDQLSVLEDLLEFNRTVFRENPEDASRLLAIGLHAPADCREPMELAAWCEVCRAILNLAETTMRY